MKVLVRGQEALEIARAVRQFEAIDVFGEYYKYCYIIFEPIALSSRKTWINILHVRRLLGVSWIPIADMTDDQSIQLTARVMSGGDALTLEQCMLGYTDAVGKLEMAKMLIEPRMKRYGELAKSLAAMGVSRLPFVVWRNVDGVAILSGVPTIEELKAVAAETKSL